jgi:hypothetical protein
MNPLNIYKYWIDTPWDCSHSYAIVAESQEQADSMYHAALGSDDLDKVKDGTTNVKCAVQPIKSGVIIKPYGYDECGLTFSMHQEAKSR